jgi:hypothetical protein
MAGRTIIQWPALGAFLGLETLALNGWMRLGMAGGSAGRGELMAWHAAASLCLVVFLRYQLPQRFAVNRNGWLIGLLLFPFAAVFPLLGPLIAAALTIMLCRIEPVQEEPEPVITEDEGEWETTEASGKPAIRHSLLDILNGTDPAARRKAILSTRYMAPKGVIPILRRALQDSDEQVRLYAQNILVKIIKAEEAKLRTLEQSLRQDPENFRLTVHLAEQYHEFVYLSLATDPEMQRFYMDKAVGLLKKADALKPDTPHVLWLLLKYALKIKDAATAKVYVQKLRQLGSQLELIGPWELEVYFIERNWQGFEQLLGRLRSCHYVDPKVNRLLEFWSASHPEPQS